MTGKDVLITGATGYIGGRVSARLLRDGVRVRALARNPGKAADIERAGARIVTGDMMDPGSIERAVAGCRTVFHFAGTTNEFKPRAYFERVNIEGTRLLAEAALNARVERFIHISSVWVYGLWSGPDTCETTPCHESGQPYSDTKLGAERVILRLVAERGLPAVIVQPSEVYGPADPNWTKRPLELIQKRRIVLADGGKWVIQPIYIDDVVEGILAAAEGGRIGESYILCGPRPVTIREYFLSLARILGKEHLPSMPGRLALMAAGAAELAARIFGRPPVFTRQEILSTMATATYDGRKAERELGFKPKISLAEGMAEVEAWFRGSTG